MTDANKRLKEEQYNNSKVWRESKKLLGDFNMIESYEIEWSKEGERYKQCLAKKRKKKIEFLMNKCGKKREIPDTIDGIIIKDQVITEDFSSEPRVYGYMTINVNECSILILPPNYAVMEKVSETKCQAEVEKGLAKLRWERQQGNDDIVNNKYNFFDVNKNVFNYSVMKPSDLPFNKRVYLPGPLRENKEIELQPKEIHTEVYGRK